MSVSGPDLGMLTDPARRGFAQALREIRGYLGGARAVELYGASGSLGAALAANLVDRLDGAGPGATLLYVVPDEETAEARAHDLGFFLPTPPASDDPLAPPAVLELPAPDSSPYAEMQPDRRTVLRRMAALFRLSHGFAPRVLVASAASLCPAGRAARAVRRALRGDHREDDARSRGDHRRAGAGRLFARAGGRGRRDVRGPRRGHRSVPAGLSPPGADRALRRRDRVDSPLRRGDAADAAAARRGLSASGARDDPDGGRRSADQDPGRRRRRRLSVVEDAPPLGAGRRGGDVLRHRGAGAGLPRADGAALRLSAGRRALRDRGSGGGGRGGAAAGEPAARAGRRPPRRAPPGVAGARVRARRGGGGFGAGGAPSAGDPAGGDRALQRGSGRSAARPHRVVAAHLAARRAAGGARARHRAQRRARRRQAAARSPARLARPRASRPHRRAEPHARRPTGRALARARSGDLRAHPRGGGRSVLLDARAARWRWWSGRCGAGSRCRPIG